MTTVTAQVPSSPELTGVTEAHRDFDEFYSVTVSGLRSQLYAYLGDREEAHDVVHEAFYRAFVRWKRVRAYGDPAAWVRRVAWNLATSGLRRRKVALGFLRKQREEHADGPGPDRVALVKALAAIPAQLRKAVVLHYLGGLSVAEIAVQEDVAEGTVKSWLSRGRAALGEQLSEQRGK